MLKFCPVCKSIISKKRISNQIVEFCNCPNRKEPKNQIVTIKTSVKRKITINKGRVKANSRRIFNLEESRHKPKRDPSNYQKLPLKLRLTNKIPSWLQGESEKRLINQTNKLYERFYRDLEDFFKNSELQIVVSLLPNSTLTDFFLSYWGIGSIDGNNNFILWYYGTKLNDRASWESKVLEKMSDIFLPFKINFPPNYKSPRIDFDKFNLKQLCDVLLIEWNIFKGFNSGKEFNKPGMVQIYNEFKDISKKFNNKI